MASDNIDPDHHLLRAVSWSNLRKVVDDAGEEVVVGVLFGAFVMRDTEDTLSATCLERFDCAADIQLHEAVKAIRRTRKCSTKSGFALGNSQEIKDACGQKGHQIRIVHAPEEGNEGHSELRRYPREALDLFESLASTAWSNFVLNADFPN